MATVFLKSLELWPAEGSASKLIRVRVVKQPCSGFFPSFCVGNMTFSNPIVGMFSSAGLSHLWGMLRLIHKINFLTAVFYIAEMEVCLPFNFSFSSSKISGTLNISFSTNANPVLFCKFCKIYPCILVTVSTEVHVCSLSDSVYFRV